MGEAGLNGVDAGHLAGARLTRHAPRISSCVIGCQWPGPQSGCRTSSPIRVKAKAESAARQAGAKAAGSPGGALVCRP